MATGYDFGFVWCWLNPDLTWEYSGYKAHWGATVWADFGSYLIPEVLLEG